MLSARLASRFLTSNGLLVLPGAAACVNPTPWALTYGAMKSAVHHLVSSMGSKDSGMPPSSITVGIAPVMLDTPANRRSMPGADMSSWTPSEHVAEQILAWASGQDKPESGRVYRITTADNRTDFIKM